MKTKLISIFFFFIYLEASAQNRDDDAFVSAFKFYKNLVDANLPDKFYNILGISKYDTIVNVKDAMKYIISSGLATNTYYTFSFEKTSVTINNDNFNNCYGIEGIEFDGEGGCRKKKLLKPTTKTDTLAVKLQYLIGNIPIYINPWEFIKNKSIGNNSVIVESKNTKFIKSNDKWIRFTNESFDIINSKKYTTNEILQELKFDKRTLEKIIRIGL